MLGEVHHELIEDRTQMIPGSTGAVSNPGPSYDERSQDQRAPNPMEGLHYAGQDQFNPGTGQGFDGNQPRQLNRPPDAGYGEKTPDQWG